MFPGWEETQWSGPSNPENGRTIRKCPKLTVFGVSVRVTFGVQPPGTRQAVRVPHRVRVIAWWDISPLEWAHGLAKMADRGRAWTPGFEARRATDWVAGACHWGLSES